MTIFTWKSFRKEMARDLVISPVAGWFSWLPGIWNESVCTNHSGLAHSSPEESCTCGFYGTLAKEDSIGYGDYLAVVEAAGKIIVHSGGIRAEYARLHAFVGMRFADICGRVEILPFNHWPKTSDFFLGFPVISQEQAETLIANSCRENGINIRTLAEYFNR